MNKLVHHTKTFWRRHGSTVLTCVGGAGVIATSVMAVKATPKALRLLEEAKEEKGEELTKLEVVKVAGPAYIPAVVTGAATLACVFGANMLNKNHQASVASAYALVDRSYKDYKKKVAELYGEDAEVQIKEELAKDEYAETDIQVTDDKKLFYDEFSKRYFESTMENVQNAEYQINRALSVNGSATINDFYEYLGIDPMPGGDELGWTEGMNFEHYWQAWIDFGHHKVVMDDGLECCILTIFAEPMFDYEYY